jgi:hypothetical protein
VAHYSWDHLRPEQQQAAWDLIDVADAVTALRRRRRLALLSMFDLVGLAADGFALYTSNVFVR